VSSFDENPLTRARALVAPIAASAPVIDAERQLPPTLVKQLVDAGLFRLLVPKWLGGEELNWLDYLDVIRERRWQYRVVCQSSVRFCNNIRARAGAARP